MGKVHRGFWKTLLMKLSDCSDQINAWFNCILLMILSEILRTNYFALKKSA